MNTLRDTIDAHSTNVQGPVHGIVTVASQVSAHVVITPSGDVRIVQPASKHTIGMRHDRSSHFRRTIKAMCEWHLLDGLRKRVHTTREIKTDDGTRLVPGRKDMQGITSEIDRHATLHAHKASAYLCLRDASPHLAHAADRHLRNAWRRGLSTVLAGACRYADRLVAATIWEDGLCWHPQCRAAGYRCDAAHWHYSCPGNDRLAHIVPKSKKLSKRPPGRRRMACPAPTNLDDYCH